MSIDQAYQGLNRRLDCPAHGQLEAKYGNQYGYEHQVTTELDFCDRYPVTLLLDSRDRVSSKDHPGQYTIKLNRSLKNVHSIELIGGKLPSPCYNIVSTNNLLVFQETEEQVKKGELLKVRVPPGDYTGTALALAITQVMNTTGQNTYRVTVDPITRKFTFTVTNSSDENFTGLFNLIFSDNCDAFGDTGFLDRPVITNDCLGKQIRFDVKDIQYGERREIYLKASLGRVLGFPPTNLSGSTSYTAPNCYNLSPFPYLALFVNDYDRVWSTNAKVDGSFCVIPLDSNINSFDTQTRDVDNVKYIRYFYPVIKEISQFTIKFVDPDGNIYDFEGNDNALIFEVGCSFGQPILRKPQLIRTPQFE